MAQPFDCLCGKPTCRGRIGGAQDMTDAQLQGMWLNGHIYELREERKGQVKGSENGSPDMCFAPITDPTAQALKEAVQHAEKVVEAARTAMLSYLHSQHTGVVTAGNGVNGHGGGRGPAFSNHRAGDVAPVAVTGSVRRGPTSRELSGEMGGDTVCA